MNRIDKDPPAYPVPRPYTSIFLVRVLGAFRSWLSLLTSVDYQIPFGSARLLGRTLVLINDPESIKQILVSRHRKYPKYFLTSWILRPLIGSGIFSANGSEWSRQRRLIDQAFTSYHCATSVRFRVVDPPRCNSDIFGHGNLHLCNLLRSSCSYEGFLCALHATRRS